MSDDGMGKVAVMRMAASALLQRAALAMAGGRTFDGLRDVDGALGYARVISYEMYLRRYRRGGVAARIIESFPDATWRGEGELVEDEDSQDPTPFEQAWYDLDARLHFWAAFRQLDVLAGIGEYAVMLLGAPGQLDSPLERLPPDKLAYVQLFGQGAASVSAYVSNPADARYGAPEYYSLSVREGKGDKVVNRPVHWTRVHHVADGALENPYCGLPRLERCWNRLDDLDKIVGGGAEAAWQRAQPGYQLDAKDTGDPVDEKEMEKLSAEFDEYMHGMRRFFRTVGVDAKQFSAEVHNFDRNADAIMAQLASASKIPQRILKGAEAGELASTQDRDNWAERVQDRRTQVGGPIFVHPLFDRLIELQTLPPAKSYKARWPNVHDMSDLERANLAGLIAKVNKDMGTTVWTADELRDRVWEMPPLDTPASQGEAPPAPVVVMPPQPQTEDGKQPPQLAAAEAKKVQRVVDLIMWRRAKDKRLRYMQAGRRAQSR